MLIAMLLTMVNEAPQETPIIWNYRDDKHARETLEHPLAHNQLPVVIVITWVKLLALIEAAIN